MLAATLKRDGIDPKTPAVVAAAVNDLSVTASNARAREMAEWHALTDEMRTLIDSTDASFKSQTDSLEQRIAAMFARVDESADAAIKRIEATEAAYKEQMQLQAPVEYWQTKATKHQSAISRSRATLIAFTIFGGGALVGALFLLANTAVDVAERAKGDTAIYLKYAAIGAIVSTIVFWTGRVLLRVYLSDRHLLTDAEERVAMIKTYLALSHEGKVEAADRTLILAPIFRSAADGIVKEDGPDTSLAAIIAKAIDVKGAR